MEVARELSLTQGVAQLFGVHAFGQELSLYQRPDLNLRAEAVNLKAK